MTTYGETYFENEPFTWTQWFWEFITDKKLFFSCFGIAIVLAVMVVVSIIFYKQGKYLRR
jgi:hypothetical protein